MDRIEDGSIQITADDFPSFVYESGTVYDENNEDVGLFQGYLLVRASTCLWLLQYSLCLYDVAGVSTYFHWPIISAEPDFKRASQDEGQKVQAYRGNTTNDCICKCAGELFTSKY